MLRVTLFGRSSGTVLTQTMGPLNNHKAKHEKHLVFTRKEDLLVKMRGQMLEELAMLTVNCPGCPRTQSKYIFKSWNLHIFHECAMVKVAINEPEAHIESSPAGLDVIQWRKHLFLLCLYYLTGYTTYTTYATYAAILVIPATPRILLVALTYPCES